MVQGTKVIFPAKAQAWMRAQRADMPVTQIRKGLAAFMHPLPSWKVVDVWLAANAPRANSVTAAIYQDDWLTDDVREWLRPRWHAGMTVAALADGVAATTERFPSEKAVVQACRRAFGPRKAPIRLGEPVQERPETRERRCCRCRELVRLPRFRFVCDPCSGSRGDGFGRAAEEYRLVGASIR